MATAIKRSKRNRFLDTCYGEYCGRHHHISQRLSEAGFSVYSLDLQGHGKSQRDRAYVEKFQHYIDEVLQYIEITSNQLPHSKKTLPRFLIGHSMGGLIATRIGLEKPDLFKGYVLIAPAYSSRLASTLLIFIAENLSNWIPKYPVPYLGIGASALSRDPNIVLERDGNALNYTGGIRLGFGNEITKAMDDTQKRVSQVKYPFLLLHGKDDPITSPNGSILFHKNAPSEDKTFKLYEGLLHEILLEPEKETIVKDIIEWIEKRL